MRNQRVALERHKHVKGSWSSLLFENSAGRSFGGGRALSALKPSGQMSRLVDMKLPTLEKADDQHLTARLAGAGSMRTELVAVLDVAPEDATASVYRRLILEDNASSKRSGTARMWAWKRLKLRYALDSVDTPEFKAFIRSYRRASSMADRGLVIALMLARTDRLFRDLTLEMISPCLADDSKSLDPAEVAARVDDVRQQDGLVWSMESLRSVTNHLISSWRETGLIAPGRGVLTSRISPGPVVAAFAAALAKAEGLTDRAVLGSRWFQFLGADESRATDLLRDAAAAGLLTFRLQADVAEIRFPVAPGDAA